MVASQLLGWVAVVVAVATRGSVLAVVAATALGALVLVASGAGARRYRRRLDGPPVSPAPSEGDLSHWMAVVDRVLRSPD